jgi:hypothetical protein
VGAGFANAYNIAQVVTGPVLAAATNPALWGRRLWAETRIALFEQAADSRNWGRRAKWRPASFGNRWVRHSRCLGCTRRTSALPASRRH